MRNAPNVIDNFVNLLGRPFSSLSESEKKRASAAVIDVGGAAGFKVEIDGKEETLSVHDVAVRFLRSLFLTAKDFLSGVPIAGAVLSVPQWFPEVQIAALKKAAEEAGLIVLQVIPASAAALAAYNLTTPAGPGQLPAHPDGVDSAPYPVEKSLDRNVVVVDMGGSSTDITVLSARSGLYTLLAYTHDPTVGGTTLDSASSSSSPRSLPRRPSSPSPMPTVAPGQSCATRPSLPSAPCRRPTRPLARWRVWRRGWISRAVSTG